MITDVELYYYRWDELIDKELRIAIEMAREIYGDEKAADVLECTKRQLGLLLRPAGRVSDIPGEPIIEVSLDDVIAKRTLDGLRAFIGQAVINAAQSLGSARDVARFLDLPARGIGRVLAGVTD
jgi:hypothetical protein